MTEITYKKVGDFYLPDILPPKGPEMPLGKYAHMRRQYLEEHQPVIFSNLIITGKLYEHPHEIDQTAHTRIEQITKEMAREESVTEQLKATDQMKWVGMMNNIRHAAEETVLEELIYC